VTRLALSNFDPDEPGCGWQAEQAAHEPRETTIAQSIPEALIQEWVANIPTPEPGELWIALPDVRALLPGMIPASPLYGCYFDAPGQSSRLECAAKEVVRRAFYLYYPETLRQAWLEKGILGMPFHYGQETLEPWEAVNRQVHLSVLHHTGRGRELARAVQSLLEFARAQPQKIGLAACFGHYRAPRDPRFGSAPTRQPRTTLDVEPSRPVQGGLFDDDMISSGSHPRP